MLTESKCNKDIAKVGSTAYIVINTLQSSLEQRAEQVLIEIEAELIQYRLDILNKLEGLSYV